MSDLDNDTAIKPRGLNFTERYGSGHLTDISSRLPIVLLETRSLCVLPSAMSDQIIDADMARFIQADVARTHYLSGWIVMNEPPEYQGKFVARLVTSTPTAYVLLADTLAGLQEQLPPRLVRSERQPADPPEMVEVWFSE